MHIPFFTSLVPVPTIQQVQQESALKEARTRASACIGHIIAMGRNILHKDALLFYNIVVTITELCEAFYTTLFYSVQPQ